ncbi:MAG: hypothetical protein ACOYO9_10090, partial [Candidatus Nanopelagicales bacterium]
GAPSLLSGVIAIVGVLIVVGLMIRDRRRNTRAAMEHSEPTDNAETTHNPESTESAERAG